MSQFTQKKKKVGREYVGVSVGVVLTDDDGRVVLTLRKPTTNNRAGKWMLPGGTVEFGDSVEYTVFKECMEETGLQVEHHGCVGVFQDFVEGQHWINFAHTAKLKSGNLLNGEPHKFEEVGWFDVSELPENTAEISRKAIDAHIKKEEGRIEQIKLHKVRE
ncbi:NUDIX domain-containing protein [Candidatus Woesearchaeota archaeon]|jgi:8-oxo-dGTP diphosphatase|nr:NUDIX domain-containing protein [Candidatus Woesearchaeota archaeon]MBT6518424.1 NUDIX domain-containing protein [Candidatus Woesearchaeota archaeon]MBT7366574.1 NUDIX domain-containing protein [Candidatus Woesearchaeota archaeon]